MGWWTVGADKGELFVGDEPLDLIGELFENLARVYVNDLGRKPKLDEVMKLLELGLGMAEEYVSDAGEIEVTAVQAKTKRRRKRQPFKVGDYFAVPLTENPKQYGFGRIIEDHPDYGVLIVLYRTIRDRVVGASELSDLPQLFPPVFLGYPEPLLLWRWRVIPGQPVREGEYPPAKFKMGGLISGEPWRIWQEGQPSRVASEEEVKGLEELALLSYGRVERRMREALGLAEG